MTTSDEQRSAIEHALLESVSVSRVISLHLGECDGKLMVGAKIDVNPDLTTRELSVVLLQAKRRVRAAVGNDAVVTIEPDVYVDPEAPAPSTSTIVMLSSD